MSRIDELVERLCPEGVEYRALGEVVSIIGGRDYKHLGEGDIPVYGSGGIMTHVDTSIASGPTVLLPRKGSISNIFYVDGPFWNVDTVFYTEIDGVCLHPRFFYHVMLNEHIEKLNTSNAARPALTRKVLAKIRIPVPPMEVQEEIVRVLDSFAELEAELEARRRQYAHYRDQLLDFTQREDVPWLTLGELAEIGTGSHDSKDALETGAYPFYARGVQPFRLDVFDFDETAIITAGDGVGVGKVLHFVEGKYALHQRAYRIHIKDARLMPRFYFHYMAATFSDYMSKQAFQSSVMSVRKPMLQKYPIPLPPLAEQQRIVDILDRFDALTTSLTDGLPAEIEARRKQYAYWRDKLLAFPEKLAA